ncbi:MAG: cation:proton antiporter [Methanocellales archaeon]|nr:cation:proton antiporter [Methanocellales archaeon]
MNILLQIILVLFFAKVFGEFFVRIGFPSVLGEIFAGIFLGTMIFVNPDNEILKFLAELGVIFLLFTTGYKEVNLRELQGIFRQSISPTIFGVMIPFIFGFLLGTVFNFTLLESLFIGAAFCPTSIGASVRVLIDLKYISTKVGSTILSAAILDDVIAIFTLAVLTQIALYSKIAFGQILTMGGKLVTFIFIMVVLGLHVLPKLFKYIQKMHVEEAIFSGVIVVALFSAFLADELGLHAVIGAFLGGLILSTLPFAKIRDVKDKVSGFSYGIFVPIFFVFIGLSVDLDALIAAGLFTALLIILALVGKILGGFIGSKLVGFDSYDSLIFGVGMMPRAEVGVVIISIGKSMGVISSEIFSAVVLMVAISLIVTPIALKYTVGLTNRSIS